MVNIWCINTQTHFMLDALSLDGPPPSLTILTSSILDIVRIKMFIIIVAGPSFAPQREEYKKQSVTSPDLKDYFQPTCQHTQA